MVLPFCKGTTGLVGLCVESRWRETGETGHGKEEMCNLKGLHKQGRVALTPVSALK